jgi:hypothetical protein
MRNRSRKRQLTGDCKENTVVFDLAVSSDDSEISTSYHASTFHGVTVSNVILAVCYKFGSIFPEIVGIYDSVKTSSLLYQCLYFNQISPSARIAN